MFAGKLAGVATLVRWTAVGAGAGSGTGTPAGPAGATTTVVCWIVVGGGITGAGPAETNSGYTSK